VLQKACKLFTALWLLLAALPIVALASPVTVFSSGFSLPESITPIPAGFGTVGGELMVPDQNDHALYVVPAGGGAPVLFATGVSGVGGVFLPSSFGSLAGDFLVPDFINNGNLVAVSGSGGQTVIPVGSANYVAGGAVIAPAGFGSVAGDALIGNENGANLDNGSILALNPDGNLSIFASLGTGTSSQGFLDPFGLAFAPPGFGSIGGDLLVTDDASGDIYAVDSLGNVSLFATVPVPELSGGAIAGLRQIAFAPPGFGSYGGDLFVSVSGSEYGGGGTLGTVEVLNSSGDEIAVLAQGAAGAPLDPRGLYFPNDNQLLIADSDPSILSAPPSAFTATPEPSTIIPLALGAFAILIASRRVRRATLGTDAGSRTHHNRTR
jgi:hypothetical protein